MASGKKVGQSSVGMIMLKVVLLLFPGGGVEVVEVGVDNEWMLLLLMLMLGRVATSVNNCCSFSCCKSPSFFNNKLIRAVAWNEITNNKSNRMAVLTLTMVMVTSLLFVKIMDAIVVAHAMF